MLERYLGCQRKMRSHYCFESCHKSAENSNGVILLVMELHGAFVFRVHCAEFVTAPGLMWDVTVIYLS